jgi:DNA-binding transcriptional MerR regulator/methanogenic corrinoid protein MtbC1
MDLQTPTYNLKAVVNETGLKPDTLRAWERRYGLPEPDRTDGGHRIYSDEDIRILKWLIQRQDEGMSISRAVDLYRRLVEEGKDPVVPEQPASYNPDSYSNGVRTPAFPSSNGANSPASVPVVGEKTPRTPYATGEAITATRKSWIAACMAFDEQNAEAILSQAFALYPTETVCVEVLMKGLGYLGEGWYQGDVTAQQEHFASNLAMRRLEALLAATPAPTRTERVLIGCPPQEEHTFVPLMLSLMLRRQGLDVIYLGADVPAAALTTTLKSAKPHLMIMTAQQLHTAASLLELAELLQEEGIPLAYGGLVFAQQPSICERIPGYYLGNRLDSAPQMVEQLLRMSYTLPQIPEAEGYSDALAAFRDQQPAIASNLWRDMNGTGIPQQQLRMAMNNMSRNIESALTLGNINLLGNNIDWVRGLLVNHRVPADSLASFLRSYQTAVNGELGDRGKIIDDWFEAILASA